MEIPADIIDWFRQIFAAANRRLAEKILNVPAIPEPHLDTTLVEHLMGYATPRAFPSRWAIRIDTHYLGGLRHFDGWEIADVGVFVFFQRGGVLLRQKVALLQSKRLYPTAGDVEHLEEYDYRIGLARLALRDRHAPSMMSQRAFDFKPTSRYKALIAHNRQHEEIGRYVSEHHMPVFYLFYNPPAIPTRVIVPITGYTAISEDPPLGARVVPFHQVANLLAAKKAGYSPTVAEIGAASGTEAHGWRLEHFMADLLLSCREGRRFTDDDKPDLDALFYRRSGPIAATIAVTVEVPPDAEIPD